MANELIIKPRFKPDEDNSNKLTWYVDSDIIIREVYLDVKSRELNFKVEMKPEEVKKDAGKTGTVRKESKSKSPKTKQKS